MRTNSHIKSVLIAALVMTLSAPGIAAERQSTAPLWQISYTRVKPGKMEAYMSEVRRILVPILDEDKRQGSLLDYKFLEKASQKSSDDWNFALILIYKSRELLDGQQERWKEIAARLPKATQPPVDRDQLRTDLGKDIFEEVN